MSLFRFLRKQSVTQSAMAEDEPQVYTAEDVTKDLTTMMLLFLADVQQCVERKQMSDELVKEKQMLQSLGLSNTKNAQLIENHEKEIAQYNAKVDSFVLMNEAWKMFGNDVMIVRYDQFMQLLEKYNLVCGDLSRYKGFIPEKNLHEIARIKGMDVPKKFAVYMDELDQVGLSRPIDELKKAVRFPYRPEGTNALNEMGIPSVGSYSNGWPLSMYSNQFSPHFFGVPYEERFIERERKEREERLKNRPRFFIAAPVQEMERLNVRAEAFMFNSENIKKRAALEDFADINIRTQDPFFCSCTEHGVLIFSKWGDEAQDDIIKRYELLSKTINN